MYKSIFSSIAFSVFPFFTSVVQATEVITSASKENDKRPNVLFIAVDDLNTWLHVLDSPQSYSPNIDRLAEKSVVFTHTYCAAPYSGPSRAATLTGRQPFSSGYYTHVKQTNFRDNVQLCDVVTLPQYFKEHGYETMGSGKIFHEVVDSVSWNNYYPSMHEARPAETFQKKISIDYNADGNIKWGTAKWADGKRGKMGDEVVAEWVAGQLNTKRDKPFFLGAGFYKPHLPWIVPQEFYDLYALNDIVLPEINPNDLDDIPEVGLRMNRKCIHDVIVSKGLWERAVQAYLSCVSFTDSCIGRILEAYENSPERDNTIIVLWSDHGWSLGSKFHWQKMALWEEETKCTFMIHIPGVTDRGARCTSAVSLLDIYPTLLDLCGLPANPNLEGKSIAPLLQNPTAEWNHPVITTWGENNYSVRSNRYRYIRYYDGGEELYDHQTDSLEWTNLASKRRYASIKSHLKAYLPDPKNVKPMNPKVAHSFYAPTNIKNRALDAWKTLNYNKNK